MLRFRVDTALARPLDPPASRYRIAAVARITGLTQTTIRMWERRYGVVTPERSPRNGRLYTREQIERLALLKAAVDAGHAIGTVAPLDDQQIRQRIAETVEAGDARVDVRGAQSVMVCGSLLPARLAAAWGDRDDLVISQRFVDVEAAALEGRRTDVLIAEVATMPAGFPASLRRLIDAVQPRLSIVVFGFATREALRHLDAARVVAVASPADPAHLARLSRLTTVTPVPATMSVPQALLRKAAPRQYDDAFLSSLSARNAGMRCECPHHIADLLSKLNAFAQYSLECEQNIPEDAALHVLLNSAANLCRETLEIALQKVLEHERIPDPARGPD